MSLPKSERLLWVDTETGALEPGELHQIALVLTDPRGNRLGPVLNARIELEFPDLADPKALEIGGYDPNGRFDAPESVCEFLDEHMRGAYMAGHNTWFDYVFVKQFLHQYENCGASADLIAKTPHHLLCTAALAMPLWARGDVPNVSLATLCEHFNIPLDRTKKHDAFADVNAAIELYKKLISL